MSENAGHRQHSLEQLAFHMSSREEGCKEPGLPLSAPAEVTGIQALAPHCEIWKYYQSLCSSTDLSHIAPQIADLAPEPSAKS